MPSSDISARMPPSPSLSMLIANVTYLTEVIKISVQMISESAPSTVSCVGAAPVMFKTVFNV